MPALCAGIFCNTKYFLLEYLFLIVIYKVIITFNILECAINTYLAL